MVSAYSMTMRRCECDIVTSFPFHFEINFPQIRQRLDLIHEPVIKSLIHDRQHFFRPISVDIENSPLHTPDTQWAWIMFSYCWLMEIIFFSLFNYAHICFFMIANNSRLIMMRTAFHPSPHLIWIYGATFVNHNKIIYRFFSFINRFWRRTSTRTARSRMRCSQSSWPRRFASIRTVSTIGRFAFEPNWLDAVGTVSFVFFFSFAMRSWNQNRKKSFWYRKVFSCWFHWEEGEHCITLNFLI